MMKETEWRSVYEDPNTVFSVRSEESKNLLLPWLLKDFFTEWCLMCNKHRAFYDVWDQYCQLLVTVISLDLALCLVRMVSQKYKLNAWGRERERDGGRQIYFRQSPKKRCIWEEWEPVCWRAVPGEDGWAGLRDPRIRPSSLLMTGKVLIRALSTCGP